MKLRVLVITFTILFLLFFSNPGFSLDSKKIIALKNAGINDETIQLIMREKTIETCSFTIQEIQDLKRAGLNDKTIQMLIKEGSFLKDAKPVVYGKEIMSVKSVTSKEIIELKDAGLSDEVIQTLIIYRSKNENDEEREKAWEMLKNMGIIVDGRSD